MVVVAIVAWCGVGGLVLRIASERADYAEALSRTEEESLRGESATRLRSAVESSRAEREAIEKVFAISVLQAVEVIEQAGRAAGARNVAIGDASPTAGPADLTAMDVVVNADGTFAALSRAIALFETLPIPAALESFEMEQGEQGDTWQLTARMRILLTPPSL